MCGMLAIAACQQETTICLPLGIPTMKNSLVIVKSVMVVSSCVNESDLQRPIYIIIH